MHRPPPLLRLCASLIFRRVSAVCFLPFQCQFRAFFSGATGIGRTPLFISRLRFAASRIFCFVSSVWRLPAHIWFPLLNIIAPYKFHGHTASEIFLAGK
jgi:hypothetical protein